MNERIKSPEAAKIAGCSVRTIQDKAAAGIIPGAARLFGDTSHWTFDEAILREWVKGRQRAACRQTSGDEKAFGGLAPRFADGTIDVAYEQLFSRKRGNGSPRSSQG